ncbi:unnamed protein product [Paramecium sonneborni]|uniref:Transmembrane protein n=1 Tax=Paramecium sonneborni TaxID=65129 RepID=A0A8S1RQI6_9CILI|nr:unnamed protein product [Paramecium sonneborni]
MIFLTLIILIKSCPWIQLDHQDIHIYPTNGEYLEYPMRYFFFGKDFIYHYDPIIPIMEITNALNPISQIDGYEFTSISSNYTHFATLTTKNQLIIYEWKFFQMLEYGYIFNINTDLNCYNINLFAEYNILLDCYAYNHFYLVAFINSTFIVVYSIRANEPNSSKMQSIYNDEKLFIIYAQYYENYSILTLFSSQYENLTTYQNQFIEFSIPERENPYIYILLRKILLQFYITQNNTFGENYKFSIPKQLDNLQVYYDYQSPCDQIEVLSYDSQKGKFQVYTMSGCSSGLTENSNGFSYTSKKLEHVIQFFFNNQFGLFQSEDFLLLYSQGDDGVPIGSISFEEGTQIFFNPYNNYLFVFELEITVYQLAIPSLQINLTDQQQVLGNTYDITIFAQHLSENINGTCELYMSITILDKYDTNIYTQIQLSGDLNFPMYRTSEDQKNITFQGDFSGNLLAYNVNLDNELFGSFNQKTYQQLFEFQDQYFYLAQFLYTFYVGEGVYFIGIQNQSISIFNQLHYFGSQNPYMTINISIIAQSLCVTHNMIGQLIIGLSENDTIYLYELWVETNQTTFLFHKFEQQFSEFLITFNNVITLYTGKEIQIMTLNFADLIIINEKSIQQLFPTEPILIFTPIQIAVNLYSLSSCLFINNINNVIVIAIDINNQPLPVTIIYFTFIITQINIVNTQLVLTYNCNSGLEICFQVWSIKNIRQPFYLQNMMSVLYEEDIQILSDNCFFYVQFSNQNVLVYSPHLPQHESLYYQLNLSFQLICTYFVKTEESLLYFENKIYSLLPSQRFELQVNKSLNFERSYPTIIYNYTVTSLLNQNAIQYTPNQSLVYLSNFTIFQQINTKTINLSINDLNLQDRTFTIPMRVFLDRQASLCQFSNSDQHQNNQYFTNETCNITNLGYSTLKPSLNFTLVTGVNNQFFALQNNTNIQIVDSQYNFQQSYDYSNLRFSECLKSTSFNLTLSSICENNTGQYWLRISFDYFGNVSDINTFLIPGIFTNIFKISNIDNLNFILGTILNSQNQSLYLLNSLNNSMQQLSCDSNSSDFNISFCNCQDFSVALYNSGYDSNQQNIVIIVYIMNKIATYQYIYLESNSFQLKKQYSFFRQRKYSIFRHYYQNSYAIQILILQIIGKQIFILITNNVGLGELYVFFLKQNQNRLNLFDFITTIPGYGNLLPISNSIYSNGLLLQQFKQGNNYLIGVYQISNFYDNNLKDPLLLLGSQTSTSLEYAFIGNIEDQNATCIAFNNGSLLYFPIYTRILKCHYKKRRNNVQINISCQNQYSSGSYEITFIFPELEINKSRWIFSLITIIAIQLIGFCILVRYRMRNYGHINTEIEL